MSVLSNMIKELRERKLWPIAIGLIVALVAVPVLLSKKAPTNLVTQPTGGLPYSTGTALPAISVDTKPADSKLAGRGRNPFSPQEVATTATTAATATSTASSSAGASTGSTGSTGSTAGSSAASTGASGLGSATGTQVVSSPATPTPNPSSTPAKPAAPAPAGLTDKQSYEVSLAITTSGGGLNTIDPLERLSVLPSPQKPLLVEVGVLQGGNQVLFAVQPGAAVGGPGTCTPGPIDCEILSLSPGQTEGVSEQTATGSSPVALFSVNSISAVDHPTAAAADAARRTASTAGRKLLDNTTLSAVSLFQYDPNVGAVVDLRNLTVGG
ncbi:MAG: hypothetical protein JO027_17875 [Solirubrobacterales bacterium]|nr:hypothetical protein [Solirubrobacterales bacterium]